jgi:hypothetical protein
MDRPNEIDTLSAEIVKLRDELSGEVVLRVGAQAERDLLRRMLTERPPSKASPAPPSEAALAALDGAVFEDPEPDEEYEELLAKHDTMAARLAQLEPLLVLCRQLAAAHGRGTRALMAKRQVLGRQIARLMGDLEDD